MKVFEFMKYSIDVYWQEFTIYDADKGKDVFTGTLDECPDKYIEAEVCTFDIVDDTSPRLTLNVEVSES